MNEESKIESAALPLSGMRGAFRIGLAVLIGMTVLLFLIRHDWAARSSLESFSETTAVGDQAYFKAPPKSAPIAAVANFQGKPLTPVSLRRIELRDSKMSTVGTEDGGVVHIYASTEPVPMEKGEAEAKGKPVYYLKTGINEYIRVQ